jgi:hypothetical protein
MPRSGFVLYTNALWYRVKAQFELPHRDETHHHFNHLFHPFRDDLPEYRRARGCCAITRGTGEVRARQQPRRLALHRVVSRPNAHADGHGRTKLERGGVPTRVSKEAVHSDVHTCVRVRVLVHGPSPDNRCADRFGICAVARHARGAQLTTGAGTDRLTASHLV